MQRQFLRTTEVARILSITPQTVRELARSGKLETLRIGGRLRFCRKALEAWIRKSTSNEHTTPQ
jgi:excisionase family DNA binding protein